METRWRLVLLLCCVVHCLLRETIGASVKRKSHGSKNKGTGVDVIGTIEFDEHHERHDYGTLDYTNHFFKKRFIDYDKKDDDDDDDDDYKYGSDDDDDDDDDFKQKLNDS